MDFHTLATENVLPKRYKIYFFLFKLSSLFEQGVICFLGGAIQEKRTFLSCSCYIKGIHKLYI